MWQITSFYLVNSHYSQGTISSLQIYFRYSSQKWGEMWQSDTCSYPLLNLGDGYVDYLHCTMKLVLVILGGPDLIRKVPDPLVLKGLNLSSLQVKCFLLCLHWFMSGHQRTGSTVIEQHILVSFISCETFFHHDSFF